MAKLSPEQLTALRAAGQEFLDAMRPYRAAYDAATRALHDRADAAWARAGYPQEINNFPALAGLYVELAAAKDAARPAFDAAFARYFGPYQAKCRAIRAGQKAQGADSETQEEETAND